jgi:hypothetical protein
VDNRPGTPRQRKIPPFGGIFLRLSERNNQGMKIMPENSVSALLLALLAWLLARVLLLLARLLAATLLLPRLLAGILALLTRVLVRIVLVTHAGSPSLNTEPTAGICIGFRGTRGSGVTISRQRKHRGRRPHAAPGTVAAPSSRC